MPNVLARVLLAPLVAAVAGCAGPAVECNPYYPVARGARWVFPDVRQGAPVTMERTLEVTSVETSGRVTTALLAQSVHAVGQPDRSAGRATTTVRCAGGAVQVSVQGAAASAAGGQGATAALRAELPGLPPADKLTPGFQWQSQGRVETTDGGSTSVTSIARQSQVDGVFPVKVPAGDFPQALRVASIETLELDAASGGRKAKQEIREWYVRGIGLVKRDTRLAETEGAVGSVEELAGYTGVRPEP